MASSKLPAFKWNRKCIIFGDTVMSGFGELTSKFRRTVKNPELTLEKGLKFDKQIDSGLGKVRSCNHAFIINYEL